MASILTSKEIGFRLKQLRQRAGVSQEKLAELVGVSTFQLQKYESGQNMLNTKKLQLLAGALSVSVQELFTTGDDTLPLAVSERLLIDAYRGIPDREIQNSILKIANIATRKV
ncbi:MAG: helix-turn-helix transcriptional regulator [Desulfuromonadaceae bacterium]|nr:helix-turn-helix transcriptional regulator [Desulfuromonadaceae bacterium]